MNGRGYLAASVLIGFLILGVSADSTLAPAAWWFIGLILAAIVLLWPGIRRWLKRMAADDQ
jgi:hypothetical protein